MPPSPPFGDEYQRIQMPEEERESRERFFERLAQLGDAFDDISDEELERDIQWAQDEVKDDMARERFYRSAAKFSEAFRDVPEEEVERELDAIRAEFRCEQQ